MVFVIILLIGCSNNSVESKIKPKLNGHTLYYSNIAGQQMNYTVQEKDIVEMIKTSLDGNPVWRIKVGQSLSWYVYFDESGERIVKEEPLFVS